MNIAPGISVRIEGHRAALIRVDGTVVQKPLCVPVGFDAEWSQVVPLTPYLSTTVGDLVNPLNFEAADRLAQQCVKAGLPGPLMFQPHAYGWHLEWRNSLGTSRVMVLPPSPLKSDKAPFLRVLITGVRDKPMLRLTGQKGLEEAGVLFKAALA
jgi:hypothetical protein